jgi:hypothetical protein
MAFLFLNLQARVKSHKHSTYLLCLIFILETGLYYEQYGKVCTALYGSIQLHTAPYNSICQVMYCTCFFLYMIYNSHHNFLWSKYFSSMTYLLSPSHFLQVSPSPSVLLNVSNTSHDHSMVVNCSPTHYGLPSMY